MKRNIDPTPSPSTDSKKFEEFKVGFKDLNITTKDVPKALLLTSPCDDKTTAQIFKESFTKPQQMEKKESLWHHNGDLQEKKPGTRKRKKEKIKDRRKADVKKIVEQKATTSLPCSLMDVRKVGPQKDSMEGNIFGLEDIYSSSLPDDFFHGNEASSFTMVTCTSMGIDMPSSYEDGIVSQNQTPFGSCEYIGANNMADNGLASLSQYQVTSQEDKHTQSNLEITMPLSNNSSQNVHFSNNGFGTCFHSDPLLHPYEIQTVDFRSPLLPGTSVNSSMSHPLQTFHPKADDAATSDESLILKDFPPSQQDFRKGLDVFGNISHAFNEFASKNPVSSVIESIACATGLSKGSSHSLNDSGCPLHNSCDSPINNSLGNMTHEGRLSTTGDSESHKDCTIPDIINDVMGIQSTYILGQTGYKTTDMADQEMLNATKNCDVVAASGITVSTSVGSNFPKRKLEVKVGSPISENSRSEIEAVDTPLMATFQEQILVSASPPKNPVKIPQPIDIDVQESRFEVKPVLEDDFVEAPPRSPFKKTVCFGVPDTFRTLTLDSINSTEDFKTEYHAQHGGDTSDESSYYDTVSSTSSTATLLRRVVKEDFKILQNDEVDKRPPTMDYPGFGPSANSGQALLSAALNQMRSLEDLSNTSNDAIQQKQTTELKSMYLKNLIVLSLSFMFVYAAFLSLRNLQSSINNISGIGLLSLSILYATFVVGCFCSVGIIHCIRPKLAMVIGMIGHLLFVLANYYPAYYTLIPATAILGYSQAVMWTAQGTYITSIAVTYAAVAGKKHETILSLFNGFFIFLIQLSQVLGNLISSTVFNIGMAQESESLDKVFLYTNTSDDTLGNSTFNIDYSHPNSNGSMDSALPQLGVQDLCGVHFCNSHTLSHTTKKIEQHLVFILLTIFAVFTVIGTVILCVFLNKLDVIFHKTKTNCAKQVTSICVLHKNPYILLLVPFMIFIGMEEAYIYAEFTTAFVTCPYGIQMIGYIMICYGLVDAIAAFSYGRLQKYVGRTAIVTFGSIVCFGLLFGMYFWKPSLQEIPVVFMFAGGWGCVDAMVQTQSCNLVGLLFSKQREAAFASLRMYESIGLAVSFAYSQFICTEVKIIATASWLLLTMICYFILDRKLKSGMISFEKKETEV